MNTLGTTLVLLATLATCAPAQADLPPGPPDNLRAERYSSSAGEVFWDRVSGQRLSYEVAFDGAVVGTTNGTSYFTSGRSGIDGTRVDVVAVRPDGSPTRPSIRSSARPRCSTSTTPWRTGDKARSARWHASGSAGAHRTAEWGLSSSSPGSIATS